ncbi:P-loop containing nucleoside triphosphate hydrolase protein [Elsinoe ampelina]|uniref:Replication factor C subunit 2 n=1 Tax=Elsinoe ampelina TaxID=302913 RepID=A0A6A6GER0_9PEZI|nr:P-loop containing nucleoside triphosphate hydrolase protein [Elsinoe ampelina]
MANFFDIRARQAAAAANAASAKATASSNTKEDTTRLQPWVEKYRPKTLSEVSSQSHTTVTLARALQSTNLPHMLFYGPPGTGKTSTILALCRQLFGPLLLPSRVLELNASDERGISIVRDKIKNFARMQLSNVPAGPQGKEYLEKYPCPPFKIIVLDEADSMTQDAQSALRRTMETYARVTRFCLICNYVTRIIDPLASRCSKFRFKMLAGGDAEERVRDVARLEGVRVQEGVVERIVECAEGDLRKAITFLQSAARLVGAQSRDGDMEVDGEGEVTLEAVEEIAGVVPPGLIDRLVKAMQGGGRGGLYEKVADVVEELVAEGWSATQLVGQLYDKVVMSEGVADKHKNRIVMAFSETDKRLVDGSDEHLTMLDLALQIAEILRS